MAHHLGRNGYSRCVCMHFDTIFVRCVRNSIHHIHDAWRIWQFWRWQFNTFLLFTRLALWVNCAVRLLLWTLSETEEEIKYFHFDILFLCMLEETNPAPIFNHFYFFWSKNIINLVKTINCNIKNLLQYLCVFRASEKINQQMACAGNYYHFSFKESRENCFQ